MLTRFRSKQQKELEAGDKIHKRDSPFQAVCITLPPDVLDNLINQTENTVFLKKNVYCYFGHHHLELPMDFAGSISKNQQKTYILK